MAFLFSTLVLHPCIWPSSCLRRFPGYCLRTRLTWCVCVCVCLCVSVWRRLSSRQCDTVWNGDYPNCLPDSYHNHFIIPSVTKMDSSPPWLQTSRPCEAASDRGRWCERWVRLNVGSQAYYFVPLLHPAKKCVQVFLQIFNFVKASRSQIFGETSNQTKKKNKKLKNLISVWNESTNNLVLTNVQLSET